MEIDVNNGALQVIMESTDFNVNVGESAKIDVGQAIDYIKSGQAEVQEVVDSGTAAFNANAIAKTNAFNANATDKTNTFNQNATDKTTAFNNNASSKTTDFNDNYTAKLGDFNDNAVDKTNDFNSNASDKTGDFNDNATSKTNDFNDNYVAKKEIIDGAVSDAQGYATAASTSADLAKQWAIGFPSEPTGNSAKYWAEQASSSLSGLSSRVSTIEGEIPAEASASNQLADKAYVSSVLPTVNNATLTIQKNGADVQTFTANASTNVTANITVPTQPSDIGAQDALVSGTNIKTINNNSILGSGNLDINGLPSQTGQSGKFLTTDGSTASWATASVTVDQVYDPTSANAQSGVAINGAGFLNNTATGSSSLTLLGTATTTTGSTNIGVGTQCTANYSTAVGHNAKAQASSSIALGRATTASGSYSVALGYGATCSGGKSIQLGYGTNSTATSLFVGFQGVDNYQLLDGTTGLIPYQRINAITDSNLGGQLKTWTGTKAQYDAIVTKDANTLYNITDDTDVSLTILEALYPVGSIYITTNAACPLSTLIAGSTWVLVGQDRVLQGAGTRGAVGTTLNESLPNIKGELPLYCTVPSGNGFFYNEAKSNTLQGANVQGLGTTKVSASLSSSTYQDNAPVQPDAYLVNIFRRTA